MQPPAPRATKGTPTHLRTIPRPWRDVLGQEALSPAASLRVVCHTPHTGTTQDHPHLCQSSPGNAGSQVVSRGEVVFMELVTGQLVTWGVMTPPPAASPTRPSRASGGLKADGLALGPPPPTSHTESWVWEPSCNLSGATENLFQFFRL